MELAGHECSGFCEYDKFATASYTSMHLITDEQRRYLEQLPLKQRQKEILKEEYRNGEWYAQDIKTIKAEDLPASDCWCAGFPCQDISIAGKQLGFAGNRSSLYFQIIRLLKSQKEEDRPKWVFLENVKNLLSVNCGWDFARVLTALDEVGYDCEWQVLNSKNFGVPQNRERVFVVGHIRTAGGGKVLSVNGESDGTLRQIIGGMQGYRVYDSEGISTTLVGNGGKTGLYCMGNVNPSNRGISGNVYHSSGIAPTITTNKGVGYNVFIEPHDEIEVPIRNGTKQGYDFAHLGDGICLAYPKSNTRRGRIGKGYSHTLDTGCRIGTLSKSGRIRRLTPRECFRLQGWPDEYFDRAAFVNSENRLYMQAGNGVTVPVIQAVAQCIC